MKTKQKIIVKKEREVNTYALLWDTSKCLLEKGIEDENGSFYQFKASLIFTAFTLEAYLNHIGIKLFKCWIDIERKLGPQEKLNMIAEHIGVDLDYGSQPWQTMKDLFNFRNDIAHAKSIKINSTEELLIDKYEDEMRENLFARTKWEKYCTKANAEKARKDVEKIIQTLHEAGRFDDSLFFSGLQVHTGTVKE